MTQPTWKKILNKVSEAERNLAKEILRRSLEKQGRNVSEETLNAMAEQAVEEARGMIRKRGKDTLRGLRTGIKAFWEELRKEERD
jgi:Mg/Co/Ni transporter MgtE